MKKIPTLFKRTFENGRVKSISPAITEGLDYIMKGEGIATVKWDGQCCAIINGRFYKRYDIKKGKKPPINSIPCYEFSKNSDYLPFWVEVDETHPANKWYIEAFKETFKTVPSKCEFMTKDGTFEAIGPHFQNNPYSLTKDVLIRHGTHQIEIPRTFFGIKNYLEINNIEGIVFWKDNIPVCKIKKTDFGYNWPT